MEEQPSVQYVMRGLTHLIWSVISCRICIWYLYLSIEEWTMGEYLETPVLKGSIEGTTVLACFLWARVKPTRFHNRWFPVCNAITGRTVVMVTASIAHAYCITSASFWTLRKKLCVRIKYYTYWNIFLKLKYMPLTNEVNKLTVQIILIHI
jgi:hypothetical protein